VVRRGVLTREACNAESFFKSSEPLFAIARVVSVRSCLLSTQLAKRPDTQEIAYKLFLRAAESFCVPSWSTSFKIPCTLAFILNTCNDSDDCRLWNALSSRDCGVDEEGPREGWPVPASISWKLMACLEMIYPGRWYRECVVEEGKWQAGLSGAEAAVLTTSHVTYLVTRFGALKSGSSPVQCSTIPKRSYSLLVSRHEA